VGIAFHQRAVVKRPRRVIGGNVKRWLFHGLLASAFAAGGGALLVWPQWIAVEGARTALEIQRERERELSERLDALRAQNNRLRLWEREGRKVFLPEELERYPLLAQAVGKREGVSLIKATVTEASSPRWRAVTLERVSALGSTGPAGEIRPRAVRVILKGSFDSVYRTVGGLCMQQQLFVPDRWDLAPQGAPGGGRVIRAEVWGTVFVAQEPQDTAPAAPVTATPVASSSFGEGSG
jgi:hypothetical protein